jgi:hypothetical protein
MMTETRKIDVSNNDSAQQAVRGGRIGDTNYPDARPAAVSPGYV